MSGLTYRRINRVEVIGHGREYVKYNLLGATLAFQDDNQTLKIFIDQNEKDETK